MGANRPRNQRVSDEEREEEQEEEVEALIEVGEREGLLEAEEGEMMRSIVDLDETLRARDHDAADRHRRAAGRDDASREARRTLLEAGHSRIPVYRGTIDNVVGVLHSRDLLRAWEEGRGGADRSARYLRPAMFVPETLSAAELLAEMRQQDPDRRWSSTSTAASPGLVTLEDLLEEIVGEIRDEHDDEEEVLVRRRRDGSWIVNAVAHVGRAGDAVRRRVRRARLRHRRRAGRLELRARAGGRGDASWLRGPRASRCCEADPRRVHEVRVRRAASGRGRAGADP